MKIYAGEVAPNINRASHAASAIASVDREITLYFAGLSPL